MYKLIFFVPPSHVEEVKKSVFSAGGGKIGEYSQCCWQSLGIGEFVPEDGATPFEGNVGQKALVSEFKVEIMVEDDKLEACLAALKLAHPYDQPAIDLIKLESIE